MNYSFDLPRDWLNRPVGVTLVGAGGNGCQMLYGLARMHSALVKLGHPYGLDVTVYDDDTVSETNVGRQLFSPADVGQYKATLLVHRVNTFYGLAWKAMPHKFEMDATPRSMLVIGCVDSVFSRREIHEHLQTWPEWWLDLGNDQHTGQIVLGNIDQEGCEYPPIVTELFPAMLDKGAPWETTGPSCSAEEALSRQDLFINQTVASFALNLLWQWFRRGKLEIHGYFINLLAGVVSPLRVDPEAWDRMHKAGGGKSRKPLRVFRDPRFPKPSGIDWKIPPRNWLNRPDPE